MADPVSNPLIESGKPLFFKVADKDSIGFKAPKIRLGDAVRLCVRSSSVMQTFLSHYGHGLFLYERNPGAGKAAQHYHQ